MDTELRHQLLRASVRDRNFLKATHHDLAPDSFPEQEEQIVAKLAIGFWQKYDEPIGGLLRSQAEQEALDQQLGSDAKKKLKALVDLLQGTKLESVSVKALEDRVHSLKESSFYKSATEEIISTYEQGKLTQQTLVQLVERANRELSNGHVIVRDYLEGLDARILRRQLWAEEKKYPLLLIDPLDKKIKAIGRGMLAMFLGVYKSGKSLALVHVARAYALQGLKVLYFTLEDPIEIVEDRLDAAMTGLPVSRLHKLPNRLRKRFEEIKRQMRGRIRVIDCTDGGWTVSRFEKQWEIERQKGFAADAIVVDYDDEIQCEQKFSGDSARRMEFAHSYRRMRQAAAKLDVLWWTAAQATRGAEAKRVVTGKDAAEDISKIRKVTLAIGIGTDPNLENIKHLYVIAHKVDMAKFGVDIVTDFNSAIFYDRDATLGLKRSKVP